MIKDVIVKYLSQGDDLRYYKTVYHELDEHGIIGVVLMKDNVAEKIA